MQTADNQRYNKGGGVKRYAPIGKNLFLVKNFLFNPPIAA